MTPVPRSAPVSLHLHIRVPPGREAKLIEFLRGARPFYEEPGGIRVRLLQDADDPLQLIEIVEYADRAAFERDDRRVNSDPTMQRYLAEWRQLLDGPVEVRKYLDLSGQLGFPQSDTP